MFRFTEEEIRRYSRHIILQEVGGIGQQKLLDAKVLVVGAGGLGSPAAFYLAAAGVGTIGIVDDDVVDLSNLQRQILHRTEDVGTPKVDSAARALTSLNPGVQVKTYRTRLGAGNVMDLIREYDVIVDGVDNFSTRYLLNDACVMAGKPLVDAGILRWDGMMMTIKPREGPCYRCIFPEPPPPGVI
ncbi:MAG TPA: HesA/MoeB/ThiF family protein, partial [Limnochordales bacterium]